MAWNHNSYEREPRWKATQKYRADNILENLQSYRISSGITNSEDYASILENLGWDTEKLAKMTDNEKMGELARILNMEREENQYYASKSSSSSKKRQTPSSIGSIGDIDSEGKTIKKIKELEIRTKKQQYRRDIKKESLKLQKNATNNPLTLDFPIPNSVCIDTTSCLPPTLNNISVFHRPIETGSSSPSVDPDSCKILSTIAVKESMPIIEIPKQEEEEEEEVIGLSKDAPMAPILGPFCVICGKYGQYICSATDDDVCSMECKKKAEEAYTCNHPVVTSQPTEESFNSDYVPRADETIGVGNSNQCEYIANKRRYKDAVTIMDSHKCPICHKTGHLACDCRHAMGKYIRISDYSCENNENNEHYMFCDDMSRRDRGELQRIYRKCNAVRDNKDSCCTECKSRSNLVYCVQCNCCYCDKYHLLEHLRVNTSHTQLYSFKLRKLIKCSNPRCLSTNIYELYMCHKCSSNLYDKYYNMKTALWRREGILQYPSLICCEDHMTWHIMNCDGENGMTHIVDKKSIVNGYYSREGIINDMLF